MHATDAIRGEFMIGRFAAAIANLLKTGRRTQSPRPELAEQRPPAAVELPRGKGEAVMIVDGDAALVVLVEQMLAKLGYRPSGFDSSQAALRALHDDPAYYDAVLIDEAMTDLCAKALASEIRRVRRNIPILLVSRRADADCEGAGIDALLRKPLLSRDIAAPLAQVLHDRRR